MADFSKVITDEFKAAGVDLKQSAADVAVYVQTRAAHLQTFVGQPGYDEAFEDEREAVAEFAAGRAVDVADAEDSRVYGIVGTLLGVAVSAVA